MPWLFILERLTGQNCCHFINILQTEHCVRSMYQYLNYITCKELLTTHVTPCLHLPFCSNQLNDTVQDTESIPGTVQAAATTGDRNIDFGLDLEAGSWIINSTHCLGEEQ